MPELHQIDGLVLAVDVGGSSIKAEIVDEAARTIEAASVPTPRGHAAVEAVIALGRALSQRLEPADQARLIGAGLAVPGVLDTDAGVAVNTVNVGWRDMPLTRPVAEGLGIPVVLSHDVTAAGIAEWQVGAGRGTDDLVVVVVGTGIAAVTVTGRHLVTGGLSQAGELGHVIVRPDGRECACGQRGCVETVASAGSIAGAYTAQTGTQVSGAADVCELLGRDLAADRVWADAVAALSDGLLAACALVSPTRVVVGGGLADAGARLLDPLREHMTKTWRVAAVPEVVRAELGSRAGVVGAALQVWRHRSTQ
jgi:glucokinase